MKIVTLALLWAIPFFNVNATECKEDITKFCAGVERGKGQIAKCLSENLDSLSPKCVSEVKDFKKKTASKAPCFEDLMEYCSELPPIAGNYEYCLLRNESKLSDTCANDFRKKKGNLIVKNVCAQDIANTCYKEITGPEGAINRCLIANKSKLSGHCQKNMDKKIVEMRKKNACFDDTLKLCPTQVKFIDIQNCLAKKESSLTPACLALVKLEKEKMKANPCYRDLVTHCVPGLNSKQQHECLTINDEHLTHACKQYREVEKKKVDQMVKYCEEDRLKFCKDAPFKDGAIAKCLRKNKASISEACRKLL